MLSVGDSVCHREHGRPGVVLAVIPVGEDVIPHLRRIWEERPDLRGSAVMTRHVRDPIPMFRSVPMLLVATDWSMGESAPHPWLWLSPHEFWMAPESGSPLRYVWRDATHGRSLWDNGRKCWVMWTSASGIVAADWLIAVIEDRLNQVPVPEGPEIEGNGRKM